MNWRNVRLIAGHEVVETIRSKVFLITLAIVPISMAFGILPSLLINQQQNKTRTVIILDRTGSYEALIRERIALNRDRRQIAQTNAVVRSLLPASKMLDGAPDPDAVPARFLKREGDITDADVRAWRAAGGAEADRARVRTLLPKGTTVDLPDPLARIQVAAWPEGIAKDQPVEQLVAALKPYFSGERRVRADDADRPLDALLVIPETLSPMPADDALAAGDQRVDGAPKLWFGKESIAVLQDRLETVVQRVAYDRLLADAAGDAFVERYRAARLPLQAFVADKPPSQERVGVKDLVAKAIPYAVSGGLALFLLISLALLLSNTMEEKANRVLELLLSSTGTTEIMVGKMIGSSLVALVQLTVFGALGLGALVLLASGPMAEVVALLRDVVLDTPSLALLPLFFILGYAIFAGLFMSIGSLSESQKDMQAIGAPMQIAYMAVIGVVIFATTNLDSSLAWVLTFVPFTAPFMLMARLTQDVVWWVVILSVLIQMITAVAMVWLSGKIFKVASLHNGRPPSPRELWRMVRADG